MTKCRRHESKEAQEQKVTIVPRHTGKRGPRTKGHTGNDTRVKGHKSKGAQGYQGHNCKNTQGKMVQRKNATNKQGHKSNGEKDEEAKEPGQRGTRFPRSQLQMCTRERAQEKGATWARWHKGKWTQRKASQRKGDTKTMGKRDSRATRHRDKGAW